MTQELSLYIHWPFCLSKCPYCDFNSHVREKVDQGQWRQAYLQEMRTWAKILPHTTLKSIFFGGGTPSLMDPKVVQDILAEAQHLWTWKPNLEITLEANPQTVEINKFRDFRAAGINRLSLGIQSLDDAELKFLGRLHDAQQALNAIDVAQKVFERYSLDFIYALPGQTAKQWQAALQERILLLGDHISAYQLTIEPGTAFYTQYQRGEWALPTDDEAADLYEMTETILGKAGFRSYEVSNYARPGGESQHNLTYWRYQDYLGIGPGAHSRVTISGEKQAVVNHKAPEIWLEQVAASGSGVKTQDALTSESKAKEFLMMGLRLEEGVNTQRFAQETGKLIEDFCGDNKLDQLQRERFLVLEDAYLKATLQGRKCLDALLSYLLK